jgi:hypothetical protein
MPVMTDELLGRRRRDIAAIESLPGFAARHRTAAEVFRFVLRCSRRRSPIGPLRRQMRNCD